VASDAEIVRQLTDEAFLGGDLSVFDRLVDPNFVSHDPPPGEPGTRDGYRQVAEVVVSAFPDRKMEFDDYIDTADGRVVESWAMIGTHSAEAFGVPASGQVVRVRGVEIWRCANGKIVEHWGAVDMSDFFEKAQAGAP
jgi:steroid delta-isomerase-like uncharacterized protein